MCLFVRVGVGLAAVPAAPAWCTLPALPKGSLLVRQGPGGGGGIGGAGGDLFGATFAGSLACSIAG